MIKKIFISVVLLSFIISCGKKGDPVYNDQDKKAEIQRPMIFLI